jgi:hypothetical protein
VHDRDETILLDRVIGGDTLPAIGERHGITRQAVHQIITSRALTHTGRIVREMWQAQIDGEILILAIPAGFSEYQNAAVDYLHWVLRELDRLWDIQARVHYVPLLDGGFAFGLEDPDIRGGNR